MSDPSEVLLARLAENPTVEDVLELLELQRVDQVAACAMFPSEVAPQPIRDFFKGQEDLDEYAAARDWWPVDDHIPAQHQCPSVFQLCAMYFETHPAIGSTFKERLVKHAERLMAWCAENGVSTEPVTPEERDAAERKRELNRQAQARYRARTAPTAAAAAAEHAERVAAAYAAYMALCRQRKELSAHIAEARQFWQKLKQTPPE